VAAGEVQNTITTPPTKKEKTMEFTDEIFLCKSSDPTTWFGVCGPRNSKAQETEQEREFKRLRKMGNYVAVHWERGRSAEMFLFEHVPDAEQFYAQGYKGRERELGVGFNHVELYLDDAVVRSKSGSAPLALLTLDVLARRSEQMDSIADALERPSEALFTQQWSDQGEVEAYVRAESFKFVCVLGYECPEDTRARRFSSAYDDHPPGIVVRHAHLVSAQFPTATFLLEFWDHTHASRMVIRGGTTVRDVHTTQQQPFRQPWALMDIFAPYRSEYDNYGEFGSQWQAWVDDVVEAVERLKAMRDVSAVSYDVPNSDIL
jgi:hypothetical protein